MKSVESLERSALESHKLHMLARICMGQDIKSLAAAAAAAAGSQVEKCCASQALTRFEVA